MIYLSYEEYKHMGGSVDEAAFNRHIVRACGMIDLRTKNRLESFSGIPQLVKVVCADLVDYFANRSINNSVSSRSQSAGAVSESVSYTTKTAEEYASDIDNIFEPLGTIFTESGVSLTYRGAL